MAKKMFLYGILFLISLGIATAWGGGALTCVAPTSFILGNANMINMSIASGGEGQNVTNCTIIATSSSTANNTWVQVNKNTADSFNNTNGGGNGSGKLPDYAFEDAPDYQIKAYCFNKTNSQDSTDNCTALTSRTIDFSKVATPTITCDDTLKTLSNNELINYSVAGRNTTACTINFGGYTSYAMTHAGDACTYTVTKNSPADKAYRLYTTATDGTNSSNSATCDVVVNAIPHGTGTSAIDGTTVPLVTQIVSKQKRDSAIMIVIIVIIVLWAMSQKK